MLAPGIRRTSPSWDLSTCSAPAMKALMTCALPIACMGYRSFVLQMRHCIEKFQLTLDVPTRKMEWFCMRLEDQIYNKGILEFTFVLLFPNQCTSPKTPSTNSLPCRSTHCLFWSALLNNYSLLHETKDVGYDEEQMLWNIIYTPDYLKYTSLFSSSVKSKLGCPSADFGHLCTWERRWGKKVGN